jgi:4-amino-4-deoxy-L-arabinose transferase-like glycosyltransferase
MLVAQSPSNSKRGALLFAAALVALRIAAPLALLHPEWEFHRDEFLYFAMADHFDLFRMQFPPFIASVALLGEALFGDTVWAARVPAALGGGALLLVLLWLVRRLGGGQWAMALVSLGTFAAPVYVRPSVLMHPVVFDQLWATLAVAALVMAAVRAEPRWWLLVGSTLGAGALTKFSAAFYAIAIAVTALLLPVLRRQLVTRWPWLGAIMAAVLAIPSLTGQLTHDWPFLQQLASLRATQLDGVSRVAFLAEQPMMLGGALVLVLAGAVAALRGDGPSRVATTFAGCMLLLMLALGGKGYYAAPGYPVLLAVGGIWLERTCAPQPGAARSSRAGRVGRWLLPGVVAAMALLLLPMGVPLLAPEPMARYSAALGVTAATRTNRGTTLPLPQDYADMLGWRAMVQSAADVVAALPQEERSGVLLVGSNYGEAGALAMYRERYGLPYPVSAHGDFHAWGTYGRTGDVTVLVERPDARDDLERLFEEVTEAHRHLEPRAVEEEQDVRIYVTRRPRQPIHVVWPTLGPRWS